jgi:putative membrane protein
MNILKPFIPLLNLMLAAPVWANDAETHPTPGGDALAIAMVMAVNEHEIEAATIAQGKDIGDAAMGYAEKMAVEHGRNQEKAQALAGAGPVGSAELTALKEAKAASRAQLARLDGTAFEDAYIDAMVKDHEEVLLKLDQQWIPAAADPAVLSHLKETREHVAQHLDEARAILRNLSRR